MDGEFYMSKPEVETLTDSFIFFRSTWGISLLCKERVLGVATGGAAVRLELGS
jgi:hypothetical protein